MLDYKAKCLVDFNFGESSEISLLPVLKKYFNDDTIIRTNKYDNFDYTNNNNILIELKTRTNALNKYEDTMINIAKVNKCKKLSKTNEIYFMFKFTDGVYYWKYNNEDKLTQRKGGRLDRSNKEIKDYFYINVSLLKELIII